MRPLTMQWGLLSRASSTVGNGLSPPLPRPSGVRWCSFQPGLVSRGRRATRCGPLGPIRARAPTPPAATTRCKQHRGAPCDLCSRQHRNRDLAAHFGPRATGSRNTPPPDCRAVPGGVPEGTPWRAGCCWSARASCRHHVARCGRSRCALGWVGHVVQPLSSSALRTRHACGVLPALGLCAALAGCTGIRWPAAYQISPLLGTSPLGAMARAVVSRWGCCEDEAAHGRGH